MEKLLSVVSPVLVPALMSGVCGVHAGFDTIREAYIQEFAACVLSGTNFRSAGNNTVNSKIDKKVFVDIFSE